MKKFLAVLTIAAVASSFSTVGFARTDTTNERPKLPTVKKPVMEQRKGSTTGRKTGGAADTNKKETKEIKKETKTEKKMIKKTTPTGKKETKTETRTKTTNQAK